MAQESGFIFDELSEFKELLHNQMKIFPEESKRFLKKEARNLMKVAKSKAKELVKKGKAAGTEQDYHKRFDTSRVFTYSDGSMGCKAFNNARHAHLIENGHKIVARGKKGCSGKGGKQIGWVEGKHVFEKSEIAYKSEFHKACEEFLFGEYDYGKKKK